MIDRIDDSIPMNELPTWLQELWELKPYIARRAEKNYLELLNQVKNNDSLHSVSGSYLPKCNRVEVIDRSGRAYTNYDCKSVETQMQDVERTLKVFIS